MLKNADLMFQDMDAILPGLKKKSYEANMELYREKYKNYFDEIIEYVKSAEDKEAAVKELADCFCPQVKAAYEKRGKVPKKVQMNLNFVMIYYIFPALLLTEDENAILIADGLRDNWNNFWGCNINYTTYSVIHDGFKNRIFGFEIG